MIDGGVDAVLVETAQDLLQAKAAVIGARAGAGRRPATTCRCIVAGHGRDDRHDAARHRDRRRADRAGAAGHRRDRPQLRHRPGRDERAPAPPRPGTPGSRVTCMPNAGLPELTQDGARLPADRRASWPTPTTQFTREFGLVLVGGCCGTTPEHLARGRRAGRRPAASSRAGRAPSPASPRLYQHVPFRQDTSLPVDRRAHQRQRLQGVPRGDARPALGRLRRDRPRPDPRRRAPARRLRRLRRPRRRRRHARGRRPARHRRRTLPLVLDSTEPAVIEAGLELLGGRAVINSVNYEDGDGPDSPVRPDHAAGPRARRRRRRADDRRGGPGPHRASTRCAVAVAADRDADRRVGDARRGHHRRLPDLPDRAPARRRPAATASRRSRRSARSSSATPTCRPRSGCPTSPSGSSPAARQVLNSVFLHECVKAGLDSAIVHAAKILPMPRIPRGAARGRARPGLRPAPVRGEPARARYYDPLSALPRAVRGRGRRRRSRPSRADELAALPLEERLQRRIIDGERKGLEADLDEALDKRPQRARHHQRPPARRHAHRRRAVRHGRDAAAVRAAVRRGDEGRRRLPRAAHRGQRRRQRRRQGHDRAGHRQGRRARHRQEPRRHHPVQQRLRRGQHRHQAADLARSSAPPRSTTPTRSA